MPISNFENLLYLPRSTPIPVLSIKETLEKSSISFVFVDGRFFNKLSRVILTYSAEHSSSSPES